MQASASSRSGMARMARARRCRWSTRSSRASRRMREAPSMGWRPPICRPMRTPSAGGTTTGCRPVRQQTSWRRSASCMCPEGTSRAWPPFSRRWKRASSGWFEGLYSEGAGYSLSSEPFTAIPDSRTGAFLFPAGIPSGSQGLTPTISTRSRYGDPDDDCFFLKIFAASRRYSACGI